MNTAQSTKIRFTLISILSLIGAGFAAYLTSLFYGIRGGTAGFKSVCNLGENMNCDAVAASSYAELFAGIPLSSIAGGWFLGLAIVALFGRSTTWRREATRAVFAMSIVGLLASLYYVFIMAAVLKTFCLFCLFIDVIAFALVVISLTLKPEGLSKHQPDLGQWKGILGTIAAAMFIAVVGLKGMDKTSYDRTAVQEAASSILATPAVPINTAEDLPSLGAKDAPVTIVKFSDYQCPACRTGAISLHALLNRYPDKVRIVLRNYPLDPTCNRNIKNSMHAAACEAAKAFVCSSQQGKTDAFYTEAFDRQTDLAPGVPTQIAKGLGLDAQKFDTCMAAPETLAAVTRDIDEGDTLGIRSTPTFFINGRKVEGSFPLPVWAAVIDQLTAGR